MNLYKKKRRFKRDQRQHVKNELWIAFYFVLSAILIGLMVLFAMGIAID